jgi:hypothetical protein
LQGKEEPSVSNLISFFAIYYSVLTTEHTKNPRISASSLQEETLSLSTHLQKEPIQAMDRAFSSVITPEKGVCSSSPQQTFRDSMEGRKDESVSSMEATCFGERESVARCWFANLSSTEELASAIAIHDRAFINMFTDLMLQMQHADETGKKHHGGKSTIRMAIGGIFFTLGFLFLLAHGRSS